jgi:hypothetical protein
MKVTTPFVLCLITYQMLYSACGSENDFMTYLDHGTLDEGAYMSFPKDTPAVV